MKPETTVSEACIFPVSFAQQRLWFLDQLAPGNPMYHIPAAVQLHGAVDAEALKRSFERLVLRHEALRTRFAVTAGEPVQIIDDERSVELPVIEVVSVAEVEKLAREEAAKPFDLAQGPLLRTQLLRLSEIEHVLLITLHHIVADGWSVGVLIREIGELYRADAAGEEPVLAELPIQYADYAVWQREYLQGEQLDKQLNYWKRQLTGELPTLALPVSKVRPAVQSYRGDRRTAVLPPELTEALKQLSRGEGATLFMTLLAAFQTLLYRYSGQSDIVVGTPIAGRARAELEGLIGVFVNTLVLRVDLSGSPSFRELLGRVREGCLGAYAHQDLPFEQLVEAIQPERNLSQNPLFQVMFILQNAPEEEVEMLSVPTGIAKFDLTLDMVESGGALRASLEYNTDLFEAETAERMLEHFGVLLQGIAADAGQQIAALPVLSKGERKQIVEGWNQTEREYARGGCVHELFEEQVRRTPDATAVEYENSGLTYAELNRRANQVAHALRERGVGPDVLVGVAMERSTEMVVALLGILKAGGAYVPVDPIYPPERQRYMLDDSGVSILLTEETLLKKLPETSAHILCLSSSSDLFSHYPVTAPESGVTERNLAYMIYTSGSTGRPKGAMNTHEALRNRLIWMQEEYALDGTDRVLQKTPFSFDVSVWEFFWPLLTGARLVMAAPGGHQDPAYLVDVISRSGITTLHFVPSMLQVFVEQDGLNRCGSIKRVICSGEALPFELQQRFCERVPAELHNLYGPTEAAIDVTYWPCRTQVIPGVVPIGYPIANTQIYILDERMQPVPVGVGGELYIAGAGLARGYWRRASLTGEKFVPDPFAGASGQRMYRTGDLARYRSGGAIEYLSRMDAQVKIRGFRIELGEIEHRLTEHDTVREAVVMAREDQPGDKRLVAYLVPCHGQPAETEELRRHLKAQLPDYMVPSEFVALEVLPLTPNGKVDRKALPRPESRTTSTAVHEAPRTSAEELIVAIWADVLKGPDPGTSDNFFSVGGHSLLATQVMARVNRAFRCSLALRTIFESPTVAELASRVKAAAQGEADEPIAIVSRTGPIPVSFAQQRLWFLDQLAPGNPMYHIPAAVRMRGTLNANALKHSFERLRERHEALRTRFAVEEGGPVQVIGDDASVELPITEVGGMAEVERLAQEEAGSPFDLAEGPLLRTQLLRLSEAEHVLLITLHHIIADGWSIGVLIREIGELYRAELADEEPKLAELPVQYADYAAWQREYLQGERLEKQLCYWKGQLGGELPTLSLPVSKVRPAVQSYRGDRRSVVLAPELSEKLKQVSRGEGATLFMTLLAAFQTLLYRYSGQNDIVVGTPIAGRTRAELEGLIGVFVNTLVLRSDLSGNPSFRETLGRVREVCLGAYAHQDLPFEQLVEAIQPERNLSQNPLFQVMFVLQNAPAEAVEVLPPPTGIAKFDLTLEMGENAEGLRASLEYNTDLFEAGTAERMLQHLGVLLEGIAADAGQRISALPVLSASERKQIVEEWNETGREYPRDSCVHELFEQQVQKTPDATAVEYEGNRLTYAELNRRANRLAHGLRERGVGPDVLVGVAMDRSPEMVVALLGILKAGGAYVPVDPTYPPERQRYMLEDSGVQLVLSEQNLGFGAYPDTNPARLTSSQNLAYVMYTSGSTGRPKGAMIPHRGIVRLVANTSYVTIDASDCVLQVSSASFDALTFEVWGALLNGARILIVSKDVILSPPDLATAIRDQGVTTLFLTSALFNRVARETPGAFANAKSLLVGGQALDPGSVRKVLHHGAPRLLGNGYGPTETTTFATSGPVTSVAEDARSIPLGRPISNTTNYILDEHMNPLPCAAQGELYIGGDGLSRGYWNQPALSAEKFVPNPFAPGTRLYKTGDICRWLPTGEIDYIGRTDGQVKIRGFRIEPGEIEAVLGTCGKVRACTVMAREDVPGDQRLVAYYVPASDEANDTNDLRSFLKERLPAYMVPSSYVCMPELPLTSNGKIDQRKLPPPATALDLGSKYSEPTNAVEKTLAILGAELLGVDRLGRHDNFFEAGGHSLLAAQFISRIRDAIQIDLPLRTLFELPTVADLAGYILAQPGRERVDAIAQLFISVAELTEEEVNQMLETAVAA